MTPPGRNFSRCILAITDNPARPGRKLLTLDCGHTVSRNMNNKMEQFALCHACEVVWRHGQLK